MFEFSSTKTYKSDKIPGVSFVVRVMTDGVRSALNLALADTLAKMRDISADIQSIDFVRDEEGNVIDAKNAPQTMARATNLTDEVLRLRRFVMDPEYFKACYVSVSGVSIDGKENPDGPTLKEFGPEELYREIVERIHQEAELTAEERTNLKSPITSAAGEGGQTSGTTVAPVDEKGTTSPATATSTSPAK